jgi:DNA topoisomerase-3
VSDVVRARTLLLQTPTLNFCVERHQQIVSFQPEPFWVVRLSHGDTLFTTLSSSCSHMQVRPLASARGGERLDLEWERQRLFDVDVATAYAACVKEARRLRVASVVEKEERRQRPPGLNTVELLKVGGLTVQGPDLHPFLGLRMLVDLGCRLLLLRALCCC